MTHQEQCLCGKKTLRFTSAFSTDVVSQIFCPSCIAHAKGDAIIFEMCAPSLYEGYWAIRYDTNLLKTEDPHFRHNQGYYLSLLIAGTVAPEMLGNFSEGGLSRIVGFNHGHGLANAVAI